MRLRVLPLPSAGDGTEPFAIVVDQLDQDALTEEEERQHIERLVVFASECGARACLILDGPIAIPTLDHGMPA